MSIPEFLHTSINPVIKPQLKTESSSKNTAASSRNEVIKKVALSCLMDLAISIAIGAVVVCFIPTALGISLLIASVGVQCAVSIIFHVIGGISTYKAAEKGLYEADFKRAANLCEWISGINFAVLTGTNAQTLIHETGHALAILSVYKKAQPRIEIIPFGGGLTKYFINPLTSFGKKLGAVGSTVLVVASGAGFTLFISSILLTAGLFFKDKYPQLGKGLICWSVIDFLGHTCYAYSAYAAYAAAPTNLTHDFVHLSVLGLNPLAATIAILSIPIIITVSFYCWKSRSHPPLHPPCAETNHNFPVLTPIIQTV